MCLSCSGSTDPLDDHGDWRSLTWSHLTAAAQSAGVTPAQALANAVMTLAYGGEPQDSDEDDGAATAEEIQAALDEADEALAITKGVAGCNVVKMVDERRYTLGVACAADRPDVAKGLDGFRDFVSAEQVEKMAWEWTAKSRRIGLFHSDGSGAEVVESYIYRGPDWTITASDGTSQVIKAGDWLLGLVWPHEEWQVIKARLVNGMSRQGWGKRRKPSPERLAQLRR